MATNAKDDESEDLSKAEDEFKKAVEEDNQEKPEPVNESEEADEEAQSDDEGEAEEKSEALTTDDDPHDKAWYKKAYEESTKEALRLKALSEVAPPPTELRQSTDIKTATPEQLYIRAQQDKEIALAFSKVQEDYPQVKDKSEYDRFTAMAKTVGKNIIDAEERLAPPEEVYAKTIVLLGWTQEDSKEKLGAALKDGATSTRTGVASSPGKSKVTDKMIAENMKWYPGKTRAEIIKELEPHIQ